MKIDRRAGRTSRRKSPSSLIGNTRLSNVGEYQEPHESPQWDEFLFESKLDSYFASDVGSESAVSLLGELKGMRRV